MAKHQIITLGSRYGRLVVLYEIEKVKKKRRVKCRCDCGSYADVEIGNLKSGNTTSCGCHNLDILRARTTHGHAKLHSRTYRAWCHMRARCYGLANDNDAINYRARGIQVCDRWLDSFENFLDDMGEVPEGLSLDRIDVNGHYCKENCRWASILEQARNKQKTIRFSFDGESLTIREWAERKDIPWRTLWRWIMEKEVPVEIALARRPRKLHRKPAPV